MLQSIVEQKMATAAYGSGNDIMVLTHAQLNLANKVIKVLEPIKEITKLVSDELAYNNNNNNNNNNSCHTTNQSINQDPWPR